MRPDASFGLPPRIPGTVCTVGTFDGVHRGHRLVLEALAAAARARGLPAVLVTFDPHPLQVVNPAAAPPLLTVGIEKSEVLAESPIDYVVVLPFTPVLATYGADTFVDVVLRERLGLQHLLVGYDHGFGRGRSGDASVLQALGAARGFGVDVVPPVLGADGRPISSTSIRRALAGGDLVRATDGLGRPYSACGRVEHGAARGRAIGFRTLNVALPPAHKLLPPEGVYAVRVQTPRGAFGGMMNLGPRPTFDESEARLEAHLFDVDGDFYGQRVRIDFIARLRETRKFVSPEALRAQLRQDEAAARAVLERPG
ncbi:MAG: bifunctional riboflavin kinase/FAD synthetase [Gemmatimonadaceae bacterium]|nr:bifunctional riboflavin kinase/FAD synthetase [Gemmatimonadaceae bacterium]